MNRARQYARRVSSSQTRKLVFAKRLLRNAERHAESASLFGPAEAVMAAQDAIELVLWEAAKHLGAQPKAQNFMNVVLAVPSARDRHRKQLDGLNELRVGAKHFGTVPDAVEARRAVQSAWAAASDVCSTELGRDLARVFLAEALDNQYTATLLAEAEQRLDDDDAQELVVCLAGAYRLAQMQITAALGDARFVALHEENELVTRLRRDGNADAARRVAEQLAKFASRMRDAVSLLALGLAPEDLVLMESALPRVSFRGDGRIVPGPYRDHEPSAEERRTIFLAVLGLAERADRVDAAHQQAAFHTPAAKEADAFLGDPTDEQKRILLARLQPGRRYFTTGGGGGLTPKGYTHVSLFGWSAAVEENAFDLGRGGGGGAAGAQRRRPRMRRRRDS